MPYSLPPIPATPVHAPRELLRQKLLDANDPRVVHSLSEKINELRHDMGFAKYRGADEEALEEIWNLQVAADELRDTAQRQLVRLLSAVTSNLDLERLRDPTTGQQRKPRVTLWARLNQSNTLEVFWSATTEGPQATQPYHMAAAPQGDYLRTDPAWRRHGAPANTVLWLLAPEYGGTAGPRQDELSGDRSSSRSVTASSRQLLKKALLDSLNMLLVSVAACCELTVGHWPTYRDGTLQILDANGRALALCEAELEKLGPTLREHAEVLDKLLERLGLADPEALRSLYVRAQETGVKPSAVYFERQGRRVSGLQLDKALQALTALTKVQQQAAPLRALVATLSQDGYDAVRALEGAPA